MNIYRWFYLYLLICQDMLLVSLLSELMTWREGSEWGRRWNEKLIKIKSCIFLLKRVICSVQMEVYWKIHWTSHWELNYSLCIDPLLLAQIIISTPIPFLQQLLLFPQQSFYTFWKPNVCFFWLQWDPHLDYRSKEELWLQLVFIFSRVLTECFTLRYQILLLL